MKKEFISIELYYISRDIDRLDHNLYENSRANIAREVVPYRSTSLVATTSSSILASNGNSLILVISILVLLVML